MKTFLVTGMSCAACSARVEKAVRAVPGVTDCAVNLLTGILGTEGTAEDDRIMAAVREAGYGIRRKTDRKLAENTEFRDIRKRFLRTLPVTLILLYLSMGVRMLGAPLPAALAERPALQAVIQAILAATVMILNSRFFRNGMRGVLHLAPNMDTLVAMGSGTAWIYSMIQTLILCGAALRGETEAVGNGMNRLYFDSAAMILTLITVGKMLEAYSKGKTTDAVRGLIRLAPKTAHRIRDGKTEEVEAELLAVGDRIAVYPGEAVPADGVVEDGTGTVDESSLTGESNPVDKAPGDRIYTATVNGNGYLTCRVTATSEESVLTEIIRLVTDATATKAPIATLADKVAAVFVPAVLGIGLLTAGIWLAVGQTVGYALLRGISVLVISCPCALGLATPVAVTVAGGVGAKHGILFKNAQAMELCGKITVLGTDKTGTLTEGKPAVTDICPADGTTQEELLRYAALAERRSMHPVATAIRAYHEEPDSAELTEYDMLPGSGIRAKYRGKELLAGTAALTSGFLPAGEADRVARLAARGVTPVILVYDGTYLGTIGVSDTTRADSRTAVAELQARKITPVMLTGDRRETAEAIGNELNIRDIRAELLPSEKHSVIAEYRNRGELVGMVGDGINDAPALAEADVGIAIGAGTDIAMDAADVVLMNSSLRDVCKAVDLSRSALRIIKQNLFFAFLYNSIGIPVAAGAFVKLFGWEMSPMLGAAAMSLSSICVVSNALRLNRWTYRDGRSADEVPENAPATAEDRIPVSEAGMDEGTENAPATAANIEPARNENDGQQEDTNMNQKKTVLIVQGMMCPHCEARVKQCLEAIPGVESAVADHEKGTATVICLEEVSEECLAAAVTAQGYTVIQA